MYFSVYILVYMMAPEVPVEWSLKKNKSSHRNCNCLIICRGKRTRTFDPLLPKQVQNLAAMLSLEHYIK